MSNRLKLPIGIQSFETIRERGYLYIDKTRHIHRLVDQGMFYFLSRPRRFGKSLLVSTLNCLFQGKKDLFNGLWIETHGRDWEWREYPVLYLDFNTISHDTPENFQDGLMNRLAETARQFEVDLQGPFLKERFANLILSLRQKTDMPVTVLVDEYDKPIIDQLGKGEAALPTARANRDILKSFLGTKTNTTDTGFQKKRPTSTTRFRFSTHSIIWRLKITGSKPAHPPFWSTSCGNGHIPCRPLKTCPLPSRSSAPSNWTVWPPRPSFSRPGI